MKSRFAFTALIFVILLSACSSDKNTGELMLNKFYDSTPESSTAQFAPSYDEGMSVSYGISSNSVRGDYTYAGSDFTVISADKIIMNGDILLETKMFDDTVDFIRQLVESCEGYTSSSNLYTVTEMGELKRRYNAVLKVPAERFEYAFDSLKGRDGLKNASQRQENVTREYSDTESRLDTRKIEEKRILSLIEKAENINDILSLEKRLSEVRTDIELYEAQLKNIDRLAEYSTININVYEAGVIPVATEETSLLKRIVNGFVSSLFLMLRFAQGVTYVTAAAIIPVCILSVVIAVAIYVIKRLLR